MLAVLFSSIIAMLSVVLVVQQRRIAALRSSGSPRQEAAAPLSRDLVEALPCPVFYKGLDGRYLGCNRAFAEYLGKTREEIVGCAIHEIAPKELADRYAEADAALFANPGIQVYEVQVRGADATVRDVMMHKATFGSDGKVHGLIGIILDITERKRAEEEVRCLKDDLERRVHERTAEVEETNRELQVFSYSMSHDLRSPLRAIHGYSSILIDEHGSRIDAEGKRLLKALGSNATRMGVLIDDMVRFLGLHRRSFEPEVVDVEMAARQVFSKIAPAALEAGVRLEVADMPKAWIDPETLTMLLRELISNCLKFARPNQKLVIVVGSTEAEGQTAYFVRDNGVGFDMRFAGKLFRVFERVHPTGQYPGSGIGLALVKRIVERHGGRVWAEGEVDGGATVHFTLPHPPKAWRPLPAEDDQL